MPVTQADVAALAGVSRRTVSNVVNDYPHISPDVRGRVEEAIAQLGYTPSQVARSLRTGRSGVIQLVIPELDVPYFAELARGIVTSAEEFGLSVLITQTSGDANRELAALNSETGEHAEGTILSAVDIDDARLAARTSTNPLVLVGERRILGVDHVGIDDVSAARVATEHLIGLGRRRIAFIGADAREQLHMAGMRRRGYQDALAAAGLEPVSGLVVPTPGYHREDGARAMRHLLESGERPDALFCATDLLAIGAMSAANALGLRIPDDIAVVGFDDLEEGRYFIPSLSSIAPDKALIARTAVELIAERDDRAHGDVVLPFAFAARTSTVG
jgi:LacI family transcriptional regulator, repressor for deo operon, udp, cdd, tsx, nupC, and nupG